MTDFFLNFDFLLIYSSHTICYIPHQSISNILRLIFIPVAPGVPPGGVEQGGGDGHRHPRPTHWPHRRGAQGVAAPRALRPRSPFSPEAALPPPFFPLGADVWLPHFVKGKVEGCSYGS